MQIKINAKAQSILTRPVFVLMIALVCVVVLRIGIYQWLRTHGYFYGIPWDSFSRTLISYGWSREPFFSLSDSYWLPLQFWLEGSVFALIRPWLPESEILVPVMINNIFFIGSVIVLFFLTLKITGKPVFALVASLLAGVFAGDVFVSYSALSEPMLIFLMLLASYLFYDMHTGEKEKHPRKAIRVSLVVLLAAATHYIGWFLALFFCLYWIPYLIASFRQKRYRDSACYIMAIFICSIFQMLWLLRNFELHGSMLYPIQIAAQHQKRYIGKMDLFIRFLIPPEVMFKEFYPIVIPGLMAFILIWRRRLVNSLTYILPAGFVFLAIWISTILAFSAPYQEPRYLVVFGWFLVPVMMIGAYSLWMDGFKLGKIGVYLIIGLIILLNGLQIQSFRNSFDANVQTVAYRARNWLSSNPEEAKVYLHNIPFAEKDVFQLISGHPEKVIPISEDQLNSELTDFDPTSKQNKNYFLYITVDKAIADVAKDHNFTVKRIGKFFLITLNH